MSDLLDGGGGGDGEQPGEREKRHQREHRGTPARQLHFQQDRRREAERDAREQLIGDAEDRPERFRAALRINHAMVKKVTPAEDNEEARENIRPKIRRIAERFPNMAESILEKIASDPGAGIERRQDEKRLEHQR